MLLGILFCTCLIVSNLMAAKIFVVGDITLSAAVLLFPVSYILNDCIAEVWAVGASRNWVAPRSGTAWSRYFQP